MRHVSTRFAAQNLRLWPLLRALVAIIIIAPGVLLGAAKTAQFRFAGQVADPPGRLIDVGTHRLHLRCQGPVTLGAPTIVLEAGLGESSLTWAGLAPTLAATHRVCAYDRAGYGWSDPAPTPPSAHGTVADLRRLLDAAGESGPYVLVGHSLGGVYARLFAHIYPSDTAGLVLLDPSHEEMTSRLPEDWQDHIREANAQGVADLQMPTLLADLGLAALFPQLAPVDPRLPAAAQATLRALGGESGKGFRALAGEIGASEAILAEVRAARISDLGDLPLVVIKAGAVPAGAPPPGLSPYTPDDDLHREIAAQSSRGLLMTLGESSHYVHYDALVEVTAAINSVVVSVRS
jgi:pimeloyl-ACP methyl ester carboxylesterase